MPWAALSARSSRLDPSVLNRNFQVNTIGLLYLARRFARAMVRAGRGTIIVTGNTSALRGKAGFAGFAPTKPAQRILAGERTIRRLLILGAGAVIRQAGRRGAPAGSWLAQMLPRPKMLVTVALANKTAGVVRALLVKGGVYRTPATAA
jgi:NAD(P)-dependent dehydrogenase (short-subunit alcohol dehydrogenase family)